MQFEKKLIILFMAKSVAIINNPEYKLVVHCKFVSISVLVTDRDGNASLSQVREIDVGALLRQKIAIKSLSQAEKLNVVTNHYKPGKDSAFPTVLMNGCNRSF